MGVLGEEFEVFARGGLTLHGVNDHEFVRCTLGPQELDLAECLETGATTTEQTGLLEFIQRLGSKGGPEEGLVTGERGGRALTPGEQAGEGTGVDHRWLRFFNGAAIRGKGSLTLRTPAG